MIDNELSKMQSAYETKNSHLEAVLKTTRKDLEDRQKELQSLKSEMRLFNTPVKEPTGLNLSTAPADEAMGGQVCPKCSANRRSAAFS